MRASETTPPIRVLIVDDHAMIRDSMARELSASGIQVLATCGSIGEALDLTAAHAPDVVLLDYDLGGESGASFLTGAAKVDLQVRVLIVSGWLGESDTIRLAKLGVMGVISKKEPSATLISAIQSVARGEPWFDRRDLVNMLTGASAGQAGDDLSSRDKAVIRCLLQGHANKEIAAELGISESAIKGVLQRLFERVGVRTRAQLVRVALERGWG